MEIVADNQRQRALKAAKTKRREEEDNHQQAHSWLGKGMCPLFEVGAFRSLSRAGLPAFFEDNEGEQEIGCAQSRRHPAGSCRAKSVKHEPRHVKPGNTEPAEGCPTEANTPQCRASQIGRAHV